MGRAQRAQTCLTEAFPPEIFFLICTEYIGAKGLVALMRCCRSLRNRLNHSDFWKTLLRRRYTDRWVETLPKSLVDKILHGTDSSIRYKKAFASLAHWDRNVIRCAQPHLQPNINGCDAVTVAIDIIGDPRTGKSSLMNRVLSYYISRPRHTGWTHDTLTWVPLNPTLWSNRIHNIKSHFRYRSARYGNYKAEVSIKSANVACFIFALNEPKSLESLRTFWIPRAKRYWNPHCRRLLIGTMADLAKYCSNQVSKTVISDVLELIGGNCRYIEINSAADDVTVQNFVHWTTTQAVEQLLEEEARQLRLKHHQSIYQLIKRGAAGLLAVVFLCLLLHCL